MNEYLTLVEAATLLPGRPHRNLTRRYMLKGIDGIKLRSIKLGTSRQPVHHARVGRRISPPLLPPNKATTAHTRKRKRSSTHWAWRRNAHRAAVA